MSKTNDVLSDLMGEIYESVKLMIYKITHSYHKKHGGDREELIAVANLAFVEAVHSYDPDHPKQASLTTHIYNQIRYALLNEATYLNKSGGFVHAINESALSHKSEILDNIQRSDPERIEGKRDFDLKRFLEEVSQEAKEIVKASIDLDSREQPMTMSLLKDILSEAKWTAPEILRAFKELKDIFS